MVNTSGLTGFKEFEFALSEALIQQLIVCFDGMKAGPLNLPNAKQVPDKQGVYQLFLNGVLVYIGKTDAKKGLQNRLSRHAAKILSRKGLPINSIEFKAVQVLVFSAVDLEKMLISHYTKKGSRPEWNHSGFGANDPGRNREDSALKPGHFDALYPIEMKTPINLAIPAGTNVYDAFISLSKVLPFRFRFEKSKKIKAMLQGIVIVNDVNGVTAADYFTALSQYLPKGWQITQFPGYVIAYSESRVYNYGNVFLRT